MRVVVAMSGGVDSSAAAALLKEQGHEVIGITLRVWSYEGKAQCGSCCSPDDIDDARAVAQTLAHGQARLRWRTRGGRAGRRGARGRARRHP